MSTKLFLPLREISTLDRRDGVALLPFCQVVGVGRGVEAHHLCLEGENVLGNKGCLKVHLADDILLFERLGLVDVSLSQLGADKELLALADGCNPVSILGFLRGVDGEVQASLRGRKSWSVQSDDKFDVLTLARVHIVTGWSDLSVDRDSGKSRSE